MTFSSFKKDLIRRFMFFFSLFFFVSLSIVQFWAQL